MKAFSKLLEQLYYTASHNEKSRILRHYLSTTPDPDRGWAIAALSGTLNLKFITRSTIKQLVLEHVDEELFDLSYDYVGELSETVAHLWPTAETQDDNLPSLSTLITDVQRASKIQIKDILASLLNVMTSEQRWALLKLGTGGLRIGMSARSVKRILAEYGNQPLAQIEALWHAQQPPYQALLSWLDGSGEKPDITHAVTFHPVMLAHPLHLDDLANIDTQNWLAEWKYDGIRVQLVSTQQGKALFSRTGDDISQSFPDLVDMIPDNNVLDGELLVMSGDSIGSFNDLQQRLNKKKPTKKLMLQYPATVILYDALTIHNQDVTDQPLHSRRKLLEHWHKTHGSDLIRLSPTLVFSNDSDLRSLHQQASQHSTIEGLMLKRLDTPYTAGRPKGYWYKWKRDPLTADVVMMYAQRGHGKRSSFYSDFTFGAWQDDTLLPVGKAYFGFTDEQMKQLDNWVRRHTTGRFGPVKEVEKSLVLEVAFDAVHHSSRHKSGLALRFPRIKRIRWDKPANEADTIATISTLIK